MVGRSWPVVLALIVVLGVCLSPAATAISPAAAAVKNDTWATCVDYTCTPCESPKLDKPPGNFSGITTIICSYKYDICSRLRIEHRTCRKAQARMCKPVVKKVKKVCTREVNRSWTKKCDEDAGKMDVGLADMLSQLNTLRTLRSSLANGGGANCGCNQAQLSTVAQELDLDAFVCGADGEVRVKEGVDVGTGGDAAGDEGKSKKGGGWLWGGGDGKTKKERREEKRKLRRSSAKNPLQQIQESLSHLKETTSDLLTAASDDDDGGVGGSVGAGAEGLVIPEVNLDGLDSFLKNIDDSVAALEELIAKLEAKRDAKKKKCAAGDAGGMSKHVLNHCVEVVENERLQERHEEKCAKRTANMLAQSVKLEALVTESDRRLAMLDKLQLAAEGITEAWVDINLTVPAFALLGDAFTNSAFSNTTRTIIDQQVVNETSLCAEVLPTLQFSVLGLGISKDQIWCPTPTGTFIGGRDLPDWAPHFLVGVGVVLGFFVSAFLKASPAIFAVMCEHPALFVVLGVVVLAGRFT